MNTEYVQNETSAKIVALNDAARKNAKSYTATRGIMSLEPRMISSLFVAVQEFNTFTEDNDPYGEPTNKETDKCYEVLWFDIDDLPDSTISFIRNAVANYWQGITFAEDGW